MQARSSGTTEVHATAAPLFVLLDNYQLDTYVTAESRHVMLSSMGEAYLTFFWNAEQCYYKIARSYIIQVIFKLGRYYRHHSLQTISQNNGRITFVSTCEPI